MRLTTHDLGCVPVPVDYEDTEPCPAPTQEEPTQPIPMRRPGTRPRGSGAPPLGIPLAIRGPANHY